VVHPGFDHDFPLRAGNRPGEHDEAQPGFLNEDFAQLREYGLPVK